MFGIPWKLIAAAVALLSVVAAVTLHFRGDARTRATLESLSRQAGTVIVALRKASGNEDVKWKTAPGQIIAMGESNRALKGQIEVQNMRIDEMAAEAIRLKARASELKRIADKAQAQRQSALKRLSDMSITPGTRQDCVQLLNEADAALNLVRSAGG